MSTMIKCYSDVVKMDSFYDRYNYLRLHGIIGEITFGWERFLNQRLYHTAKWRKVRNQVIIRDNGCDLAHPDYEIRSKIIVHHMTPITAEQIENDDPILYDPEFLICCSPITHNAIHYADASQLPAVPIVRRPGDTCPWK